MVTELWLADVTSRDWSHVWRWDASDCLVARRLHSWQLTTEHWALSRGNQSKEHRRDWTRHVLVLYETTAKRKSFIHRPTHTNTHTYTYTHTHTRTHIHGGFGGGHFGAAGPSHSWRRFIPPQTRGTGFTNEPRTKANSAKGLATAPLGWFRDTHTHTHTHMHTHKYAQVHCDCNIAYDNIKGERVKIKYKYCCRT